MLTKEDIKRIKQQVVDMDRRYMGDRRGGMPTDLTDQDQKIFLLSHKASSLLKCQQFIFGELEKLL